MHFSWTYCIFVFYLSLLTAKSVDLAEAYDGLMELSILFIVATLITEVLFEYFLLCNGLNIADNET